jgi:hypothetical protein
MARPLSVAKRYRGRAIERDPHPNQAFAVIDQQPDVQLDAGQLRDRQPIHALAERGAGHGERVDAIGLAALMRALARPRGQVRRDPQHPLAALDEEPFERSGDVPAVLKRPDRSSSTLRAHRNSTPNPRRPTAIVCSPSSSPVAAATAAIVCERL